MLKSFKSKLAGFLVGISAAAGLAIAANTFYTGYNPNTNQQGFLGLEIFGGTVPLVTGTTGCGTISTPVGGTSRGEFTIGTFATSCAITITTPTVSFVVSSGNNDGKNAVNSSSVPNGMQCTLRDLTTGADTTYQVSYTVGTVASSCVFNAATFVTGDKLQYSIAGY